MGISPLTLGKGLMGTVAVLYTVPSTTITVLKSIDIVNFSAEAVEVHVYIAESASAPGNGDHIICEVLQGKRSYGWEGEQTMIEGQTLQIYATPASKCSIRASGVEITA